MAETPSPAAGGRRNDNVSLREGIYRYFFFAWLFRDADIGSGVERTIALRHNRDQAKWLPIYMLRWIVGGAVILALEALSEHVTSKPVLSALLAVGTPVTAFGKVVHRHSRISSNLRARPRVCEPCRQMGLQPFGGTRKVELHVPPGSVDVVSEDVQLRAISLCLDSHSFLRL
jgi:hypothetical protein